MIIKTERLVIRRVEADDWPDFKEMWIQQSESEYAVYDHAVDTADADIRHRIARWAEYSESTEHMFFAVCLQEKVIGFFAFNMREHGYEIGYCFNFLYHGKGYARESLFELLSYVHGTLNAGHFFAGTAVQNTPSVNLLRSLGFEQTGSEMISFHKDAYGRDIFFEGGLFELQHKNINWYLQHIKDLYPEKKNKCYREIQLPKHEIFDLELKAAGKADFTDTAGDEFNSGVLLVYRFTDNYDFEYHTECLFDHSGRLIRYTVFEEDWEISNFYGHKTDALHTSTEICFDRFENFVSWVTYEYLPVDGVGFEWFRNEYNEYGVLTYRQYCGQA